nr:recombinase family protein [Acidovorax sp. Root217]
MPQAVSYIRFSSGSQAKGSSVERQKEAFDLWLGQHTQYIESTLSRTDKGVSGYTRANLEKGRGLHDLLMCIEAGQIKSGDAVVVEAIDRLGRSDFFSMLAVLQQLLVAGVSVVTLEDRKTYTHESVNNADVYMLVAKIQAAHDYSKRLGTRISAAYERKRKDARAGKDIRLHTPFWLNTDGTWRDDPAVIVRGAIAMYLGGKGTREIARKLSGMHAELSELHPRTIKRWFSSKALIGEWENKGDPIAGVFDPLIDESTYLELQVELKRRATKPAPADKYLMSGMVWCAECGGRFQIRRQKPKPTINAPLGSEEYAKKPVILYANCKTYLQKGTCKNKSTWPYEALEFIYRQVAVEALYDIAMGIAEDTRSKDLESYTASIGVLRIKHERASSLYMASGEKAHLDLVIDYRSKIEEFENKAELLRASLLSQSKQDASIAADAYQSRQRGGPIQEQLKATVDELTSRPAYEIAFLLKRYIEIKIKGKEALSTYDGFTYTLLRRAQKYLCYFVSCESPDTGMVYFAIERGVDNPLSALSIERLFRKLESRLGERE